MYDKQRDAIFNDARYALIEASTKSGKTVGCIAWLFEQALRGKAGRNYWWVAPVYPQAKIAFRRLKRGVPAGIISPNESELSIGLLNGTTIHFKSAEKPDNLYGEDVYAAVIDEATRIREESWHAVRSTLTATRGPVRIIGNVKGRRNWAYKLARKAESGEPGMAYAKITALDAVEGGVLDAAEIEDARRQLPENIFRELYLAEPSDDEGNPFGMAAIRNCIAPLSGGKSVAWGWDLAKSVDWTVGVGLDAEGRVCRFERFQEPWRETKRRIIEATNAPALVDSTGVGDPVVEDLQRDGGSHFEGFKFSAPSKQQLMEGLAVAIQQGRITYPSGPIVAELEAVEYEYSRNGVRYAAPEGMHDDCVMALALAVSCANLHPVVDLSEVRIGKPRATAIMAW
ncbi:MAG TPA: terminase family protein [Limnochordia bacterium]|nr:terminase family protein [Limnochordia bacterium]